MKKLIVILISIAIVFALGACGVKEKIENKVGEVISEKAIEGISEGKVDISGDKVTIKGENGAEVTFGTTDWPKSDLGKSIPVFKDGKITSVMDSNSFSMIIIEEVGEKEFISYLEGIKKNFTADAYEMKTNEVISYGAGDGKGFGIQLSYELGNKTLTISASQAEK